MFHAINFHYDAIIRVFYGGLNSDTLGESLESLTVGPEARNVGVTSTPLFLNIARKSAFPKLGIQRGEFNYTSMVDETFLDLKVFKTTGDIIKNPFPTRFPKQFGVMDGGVKGYCKSLGRCDNDDDCNDSQEHLIANVWANSFVNLGSKAWSDKAIGEIEGHSVTDRDFMYLPMSKEDTKDNTFLMSTDSARFIYSHRSTDEATPERLKESYMESGCFYWYKDRDNLPSAVREIEYNELITRFLKESATPDGYASRYSSGYQAHALNVARILDRFLNGKIIIVDFKRINTTLSKDNKHCPILNSYLRNGYRASESEPTHMDIIRSAFQDFSERMKAGKIDFEDGYEYYMDRGETHKQFAEFLDRGFYTESNYRSFVSDGRGDFYLNVNKAICLFRTIVIDVEKSGLLDQDCVYDPQSGLLFGRFQKINNSNQLSSVDFCHHPDSEPVKLSGGRKEPNSVSYLYVNNTDNSFRRLYTNCNGLVIEINSTRNKDFSDGLYVMEINETGLAATKYIPKDLFNNYGIFTRRCDAETYTAVNDVFLNHLEGDLRTRDLFNRYAEMVRKDELSKVAYEREIAKRKIDNEILRQDLEMKKELHNMKMWEEGLKLGARGIDIATKIATKGGFM